MTDFQVSYLPAHGCANMQMNQSGVKKNIQLYLHIADMNAPRRPSIKSCKFSLTTFKYNKVNCNP